MKGNLLQGFQFGRWRVEPLLGAVLGPDGEARHLEPKVMDAFVLLAGRANELVTRDEFLEAVWQGTAVTDEPLTRAIGELRRALQDEGGQQQYIETVPKRGYRLIGQVLPLSSGADTGRSRPEGRLRSLPRRIVFPLLAVITVALVWVAYDRSIVDTEEKVPSSAGNEVPEISIAVLPFVNMSPDPGQEYFSDGLAEEILSLLSRVPRLRVIARTSSFAFKGQNEDVRVIGEKLGAKAILEGSVRKSGEKLRVSAQLIDTASGTHIWSGRYDRKLDEIFAIQDAIAAAIVTALGEKLGLDVERVPQTMIATNIEAYDAYLLGKYLVFHNTRATIEGAIRELDNAIALDPDFALAHAELAIALLYQRLPIFDELSDREALSKAAFHAERAMSLRPDLAESHAAMGLLKSAQASHEEAETYLRRAIQLNPSYTIVYYWLGLTLAPYLGRYAEGFEFVQMAMRLDPLSRDARFGYVMALIHRNRLVDAELELEVLALLHPVYHAYTRGLLKSAGGKWADEVLGDLDALRIDPGNVAARNFLAHGLAVLGLEEEVFAVVSSPEWDVLHRLGRTEDAIPAAAAAFAESPTSAWTRHDLGLALAGVGDYGRARSLLEEAWQRSGGRVTGWGIFQLESAAALIAARRAADDGAPVEELVEAIKDNARRYREAGMTGTLEVYGHVDFEDGVATFLGGERERGLALIEKAVREGMAIWPNEAYLQALYDDPDFAPIRTLFEDRKVRERARFLHIVCSDNPYAEVWRPASETCARVAASAVRD